MARILVTDGIDGNAADKLKKIGHDLTEKHFHPDELEKQIKNFDGIIVRSATKITKQIIDAAEETKKLKLIIRAGVGVDNIDVTHAAEKGITVCNTPAASSASVAELAIAQMFVLARHIHRANVTMREGKWNKKEYKGIELGGKTLGLIGFGRIAKETAKRAYALGVKVLYTNRSGKKDGYDSYRYAPLGELLKNADFISLHIPYDKSAGAAIGKKEFNMMKDGAYLINCARGGVVDEDALLEALDSGKIAGAAMDVFAVEPATNMKLLTHERVSVTPHIGASTKQAQQRIGEEIIAIVKQNLKQGEF